VEGQEVTIEPAVRSYDKDGGGKVVVVTADAGESWTAQSNASWIDIPSQYRSGEGSGQVVYLVEANLSADTRRGTIQIGNKTHTVIQTGYEATLNPESRSFGSGGGTGQVEVSALPSTKWTAKPDNTWITVTYGSNGIGNGEVGYRVSAHGGVEKRTGTITVAGKAHTVVQEGVKTVLTPKEDVFDDEEHIGFVGVSALFSTEWEAQPRVNWITIVSGGSGTGDGTVSYRITANPSVSERVGEIEIEGSVYRVRQGGTGASYSIAPLEATAPAVGAFGTIAVTATPDAPWEVESEQSWLRITSGLSGKGSGEIKYVVSSNPSVQPRVGTVNF
jgi:hypothetical protein